MRRSNKPRRCGVAIVTAACVLAASFLPQRLVQTAEIHLFVSFWAPPTDEVVPHRAEVEAAIAVNLANPHVSVLHVLLETTADFGCPDAQNAILSRMARSTALLQHARFVCREFITKVSYYDMFTESIKATPWNAIAIVADADQVFDETLQVLQPLKSHTIAVISDRGLNDDELTPQSTLATYATLVNFALTAEPVQGECKYYRSQREAWQAIIFRHQRVLFDQNDFRDMLTGELLAPHQPRVHQAVLNKLLRLPQFKRAVQLCEYVRMWHFHRHVDNRARTSVPVASSYSLPEGCVTLASCLER